ncbi:MAG: glutaredoxin [Gammaproteobacteria bacterium]|nr:glutaredoxin [Gammaproteobacteria bacterium]
MSKVKIYSTGTCPMCVRAKGLLEKWGIEFAEVRVDIDRAGLIEYQKVTNGARTVPQITVNGKWIGSLTELTELHMDGELDHLMQAS